MGAKVSRPPNAGERTDCSRFDNDAAESASAKCCCGPSGPELIAMQTNKTFHGKASIRPVVRPCMQCHTNCTDCLFRVHSCHRHRRVYTRCHRSIKCISTPTRAPVSQLAGAQKIKKPKPSGPGMVKSTPRYPALIGFACLACLCPHRFTSTERIDTYPWHSGARAAMEMDSFWLVQGSANQTGPTSGACLICPCS